MKPKRRINYNTAVAAIVEDKGKILVGKKIKGNHFLSQTWHLPGGKPNNGEAEEEAIIREIKEEAGIEIKIIKFIDEKRLDDKKIKVRWYLCSPVTSDLKPGSDLVEIKFAPKKELLKVCHPKAISLWPPKVREYLTN